MFAYVFNARLYTIRPVEIGLTISIAVNALESTPPIGRGQILRLNDVMKDISLNQGRELAARRITQGSPGFILQTVKALSDYLITCVRGNPEWPGLLRGK